MKRRGSPKQVLHVQRPYANVTVDVVDPDGGRIEHTSCGHLILSAGVLEPSGCDAKFKLAEALRTLASTVAGMHGYAMASAEVVILIRRRKGAIE